MTKTPEEYFQDQDFQPEPAPQEAFTEAEKAFIEKYLGLEEPGILEKLGIEAPVEATRVSVPLQEFVTESEVVADAEEADMVSEPEKPLEQVDEQSREHEGEETLSAVSAVETVEQEAAVSETTADMPLEEPEEAEALLPEPEEAVEADAAFSEEYDDVQDVDEGQISPAAEPLAEELPLEQRLRRQSELQLVSFFVGKLEYTLPIEAVQEVVRAVKPTQVPEAPDFIAGLVNLRGRVTPLVHLDKLLNISRPDTDDQDSEDDGSDKFIVVCRKKGLQVGFLVRELATMYRVPQERIEWNIESRLGGAVELVTALLRRQDDILVGILSIDRAIEKILKR